MFFPYYTYEEVSSDQVTKKYDHLRNCTTVWVVVEFKTQQDFETQTGNYIEFYRFFDDASRHCSFSNPRSEPARLTRASPGVSLINFGFQVFDFHPLAATVDTLMGDSI